MSRDSRDDDRDDRLEREAARAPDARTRDRSRDSDPFTRHLDVPRGETRERLEGRDRTHLLDETDVRALATIGAFRVVAADDLRTSDDLRQADPGHLADEGLITRDTLTDTAGSQHILSLTREGQSVLDALRSSESAGRAQTFYAGVTKPRELAHDVQVYRAFKEEARAIESEGGHVTRVLLDYELKREYQQFLNRDDRPDEATLDSDRQAFAAASDLPIVDGHLELPDLRIEYEDADGRLHHRDVEVVTEHYSSRQLSGKAHAGFACYRAGGTVRRGGTPTDPRHLTRLT